jgi:hypothetical protein
VAFLLERNVKKEEVMAAILACTEKLGRVPTVAELTQHQGVGTAEIRRHFGNYGHALEACDLEMPEGSGRRVEFDRLFRDWVGVARKLKKIPSVFEYTHLSKYSVQPLRQRFGAWSRVPVGIKLYAEEHGLAEEWKDVLELVTQDAEKAGKKRGQAGEWAGGQAGGQSGGARMFSGVSGSKIMDDRAIYGPPLRSSPMIYAPTNEMGVVCLFGAMAEELGFLILRIQTGYPDCEAMRVVEEDRLQPVKIELEYESRNFQLHMHDPAGCDLIVCWEHNWPECPLEVIELKQHCQNCQTRRK